MTSTLHDALHSYDSIDELLGDGRHRFFSHGYKNTNPMLRELRISHTPAESQLTARAGLALSGGWSTKGTSQQTPHLGTTDVMVLGARMSEAMLASRHSPGLLPGACVQSVTVSGGQTPVEGSLEDLECSASLTPDAGGQGPRFGAGWCPWPPKSGWRTLMLDCALPQSPLLRRKPCSVRAVPAFMAISGPDAR